MRRPRVFSQADLRKKVRPPPRKRSLRKPALHVEQILAWAKAHHRRTGKWPKIDSGEVHGVPWESWVAIDSALTVGIRGLPKRLSLAKLLWKRLGVRNAVHPPDLKPAEVLEWVDEHRRRTGHWPTNHSGRVRVAPEETWCAIDHALKRGTRGMPGGLTLARWLAKVRGVRHPKDRPNLSLAQILAWADRHHARTGHWPHAHAGPIGGSDGETWSGVDHALGRGARGLPAGAVSLAEVLARHRRVRNVRRLPPLTIRQILQWADAHHARTGRWPTVKCGRIVGGDGGTWRGIRVALAVGLRGLPRGGSLAGLLAKNRAARMHKWAPRLTIRGILQWADQYRRRTGEWPGAYSGVVAGAEPETWAAVNAALINGRRGLRGGVSLKQLLIRRRGASPRGRSA